MPAAAATSTLGTFYPTPYITVRGNAPLGGGYSPLEIYGDQTLSLYGPLSPFRTSTAPVLTYVRGYDGQTRLIEAASFSNPNLPILSPVRYPTEGNYYYGPRVIRTHALGSTTPSTGSIRTECDPRCMQPALRFELRDSMTD